MPARHTPSANSTAVNDPSKVTPYRRLQLTVLNGPSQVTPSRTLHATSPSPTLRPSKPLDRTRRGPCRRVAHPVRCAGRTWSQSRIWWWRVLGLLLMPARAMLSFLPCGVVPLVLPFDASACDALVFAVRCRATRACVRDAAVALLRVPVHKACYDAGFARAGRGREVHVVGGRRGQVMFLRRASSTWVVGHRREQALRV